ncbi:hypothetical protein ABK040_000384 [Willaertia magna]
MKLFNNSGNKQQLDDDTISLNDIPINNFNYFQPQTMLKKNNNLSENFTTNKLSIIGKPIIIGNVILSSFLNIHYNRFVIDFNEKNRKYYYTGGFINCCKLIIEKEGYFGLILSKSGYLQVMKNIVGMTAMVSSEYLLQNINILKEFKEILLDFVYDLLTFPFDTIILQYYKQNTKNYNIVKKIDNSTKKKNLEKKKINTLQDLNKDKQCKVTTNNSLLIQPIKFLQQEMKSYFKYFFSSFLLQRFLHFLIKTSLNKLFIYPLINTREEEGYIKDNLIEINYKTNFITNSICENENEK